ncbi:hypothetical protein GF391_03765 [Candidatus Uhrbacteria bacterium]|nr:hypothetical protein [Candidatus Uhrbacteria bacterium]
MRLTQLLLILPVLGLFGAGCVQTNNELRTTNNDSKFRGSIDPCELVDQSEVDALFGVESEIIQNDKEPQNATGQKLCVYDVPSEDAVTMAQIGVQESKDMVGGMTAEDLFNSQKEFLEDIVEVQDLGDASYQSKMDFVGGGALYTLAKNKSVLLTVDVSLGKKDHEANQRAERELMGEVLEKFD